MPTPVMEYFRKRALMRVCMRGSPLHAIFFSACDLARLLCVLVLESSIYIFLILTCMVVRRCWSSRWFWRRRVHRRFWAPLCRSMLLVAALHDTSGRVCHLRFASPHEAVFFLGGKVVVVLAEVVPATGAVDTSPEPQLPGCNSSLNAGTISPTRPSWRRTHDISPTTSGSHHRLLAGGACGGPDMVGFSATI